MPINKQLLKAQQNLRSGCYAESIEILDKHLKRSPGDISGLMLRGEAFLRSEKFEAALSDYAKVVEADSKNILALNNFSLALIRCGKPHEAKDVIAYVHELDPNNFPAYINLGNIHQALGEYQEAISSALQAVKINPKNALAYLNLGTSLGSLGLVEDSKQSYLMAEHLDPDSVITKINLAQLEERTGNSNEARLLYEKILNNSNITPLESQLVKYYLSFAFLCAGQLDKGWDHYDYGFGGLLPNSAIRSLRKFNQPVWTGELDEKKTILIWREQGLGDEILFSTCLNELHDLNIDIILECDGRLVSILQRTYPKFKIRKEAFDDNYYPLFEDFEKQIAIGSLPRHFRRSVEAFNIEQKKWKPLPKLVGEIKERLHNYQHKVLVGICWRSSLLSVERNLHYTGLQDWVELLKDPNYQFVNLLHGDCEAELVDIENAFDIQILRWSDINLKDDLETVLALVSQLDCVVSIGSAVSVIAAAAGVNTLVLMQKSWVLLGNTNKYHWFPNVRPFAVEANEHVGINIKNLKPYMVKKIS